MFADIILAAKIAATLIFVFIVMTALGCFIVTADIGDDIDES